MWKNDRAARAARSYEQVRAVLCKTTGSLRSATATSTKTSPQNITLLYHKSFAIIPSCSHLTLSVKYPRNELVREISEWKERNERFTVACSRCRQNLEFGDFTSLLCRGPQKYLLKSVLHVQHDYLWFFNQWYHCFVTLLLPSPSLFLKLPNNVKLPHLPFWWILEHTTVNLYFCVFALTALRLIQLQGFSLTL